MNRFKANCRFHIKDLLSVAGWMYAVEILFIIAGVIFTALVPNTMGTDTENEVPAMGISVSAEADGFVVTDEATDTYLVIEDGEVGLSAVTMNFSGMEATSWITFLIAGIACSWIWLKVSMANCIPRRKEFLSAVVSISIFAVFLVAGNYIINFICEIISDKAYYGAWDLAFGMENDRGQLLSGGERFLYHFAGVIYNYIAILSCFFCGYFIGVLYYRMNTALKIAVSVGVPVLIFVGLPLISYIIMSTGTFEKSVFYNIGHKIGEFFSMVNRGMWLSNLKSVVELFVSMGLSFLLIRKAPVK